MKKIIDTDRIPAAIFDKMKDQAKKQTDPIDNTKLVKEFRERGGRLLHIRPQPGGRERGLTAAYIVKGGRVEIATGCQHRADDFTKKIGAKMAIEHFNAGKTVHLPVTHADFFSPQQLKSALGMFA